MNEPLFLGKKILYNDNIFDCLIVGTGAAGFNAAIHLHDRNITNIMMLTENRYAGTSRNTGSDKQTYYKIACAGDQKDSPMAMAETLFSGGSMDGDIALCEASHSLQEFFHLVSVGVDFPHNLYGEFAGYKTDHDPLQRASSVGPYTSKKMTENLEAACIARNIKITDKRRAVKLLTDSETGRAFGLLTVDSDKTFHVYFAKNIIFATGGNPGIYDETVYPLSHFGASGILVREGVRFSNMTEWQYGIGSVKFRWNLSGSFQQVIPRYISIDENGKEDEFLNSYFSSSNAMQKAVFLKGYQWPFDPAKISGEGSSLVDMAVYIEKHVKKKRVFLDFTRNPRGFSLDEVDETAYEYLEKSNALDAIPLQRLLKLNPLAYELYKSNGIDLAKDLLEIGVLPQHHNGGVEVDIWWESSVKHLFAIGECAGTHGVHRPGGSALNSGQVGGCRAAYRIAGIVKNDSFFDGGKYKTKAVFVIEKFEKQFSAGASKKNQSAPELLKEIQKINSNCAACIRPADEILESAKKIEFISCDGSRRSGSLEVPENIIDLFKLDEVLLMSRLLYNAVSCYIDSRGKSRGSYIVIDSINNIMESLKGVDIDVNFRDKVLNTAYLPDEDKVFSSFRKVRPIPASNTWFEQVWREYREGRLK